MKVLASSRTRIAILAGVTLCFIAFVTVFWQPTRVLHWRDFRTGNKIISRVEAFRKSYGHLPETLRDVGITDPDLRVFYQKTNDNDYIVWFGTTLGESETYDSHTKKWE